MTGPASSDIDVLAIPLTAIQLTDFLATSEGNAGLGFIEFQLENIAYDLSFRKYTYEKTYSASGITHLEDACRFCTDEHPAIKQGSVCSTLLQQIDPLFQRIIQAPTFRLRWFYIEQPTYSTT